MRSAIVPTTLVVIAMVRTVVIALTGGGDDAP
jgi:hypothetical protein